MKLDDLTWDKGCCASVASVHTQDGLIVLTRPAGSDMVRVERYGHDNRQIGEVEEMTLHDAETIL